MRVGTFANSGFGIPLRKTIVRPLRWCANVLLTIGVWLGVSLCAYANPHLNYIPDDTPFFIGSLKPQDAVPWFEMYDGLSGDRVREWLLDLGRDKTLNSKKDELIGESESSESQDHSDTGVQDDAVVNAISEPTLADDEEYIAMADWVAQFVDHPVETFRSYGIDPSAINLSSYMVGPAFVVRLTLAEPDRFLAAIKDFEAANNITPLLLPLVQPTNEGDVRLYDLSDDQSFESRSAALAIINGDAIFSFSFKGIDQDHYAAIEFAPGIRSLADTDRVAKLQAKHDLGDHGLGFISSKGVLSTVQQMQPDLFDHPACDAEVASLTDIWPQWVWGYRDLEPGAHSFYGNAYGILEISHPKITSALQKMRGLIPEGIKQADSVLTYAIGVDAGRLGQAAGELALLLSNFSYECPLLAELNKIPASTLQQGVFGLNMMSGFAQGVRGYALALFDLQMEFENDPETGKPTAKNPQVDALFSVQARNPAMLAQMAKAIPQLSEFNLPADGSPIDIKSMIAEQAKTDIPMSIYVAQQTNRIIGYTGQRAAAIAEQTQEKDAPDNGFIFFSMNPYRYFELFTKFMAQAEDAKDTSSESSREMMEAFVEIMDWMPDGRITQLMDFTDDGIEVHYTFDLKKQSQ